MTSSSEPWRILNVWRSFTSVHARQDTGSHVLRIDGVSALHRMVPSSNSIASPKFSASGHRWRLLYYPTGKKGDSIAIRLKRHDNPFLSSDEPLTADCQLSILDHDGNPVYSCSLGPHRYANKKSRGVDIILTEQDRKEALKLMEDDSIVVKCDVTVQRFAEKSRVKQYLRRFLE